LEVITNELDPLRILPRRPGRPRKGESPLSDNKSLGGLSAGKIRKIKHNRSASRSRWKFNTKLKDLRNGIPEDEKVRQLDISDDIHQPGRAEQLGVTIDYIKKFEDAIGKAKVGKVGL
jgi:hypothetical protein